ncbi:MAG: hypothetical protein SF187_05255 [Deltaproteobacteria bacterium]|nr:hypothetical protein [Deltaproteobacteria bacterium]
MFALPLVLALLASPVVTAEAKLHIDVPEFRISKVQGQEPGTRSEPRHRTFDTLLVFLSTGSVRVSGEKQRPLTLNHDVSHVLWRPAGTRDVIENLGAAPLSFFEVEIKDRVGAKRLKRFPDLDPVAIDHKHYQTLFENKKIRVVRALVNPGDNIPMHQHDTTRVNIFVTKHQVRVTDPQGVAKEGNEPPGSVKVGGPCKHDEVSLSDQIMDTVIIDSKFLP